jgi:tetratricopeptide (TPR) repeat protein
MPILYHALPTTHHSLSPPENGLIISRHLRKLACFLLVFFYITLLLIFFLLHFPASAQTSTNFAREAQTALQKGQFVEALKNLNLAIQSDPSIPELYYMRGYAKFSLDDYIGAEQDFTKSITLFPYLPDVFLDRAMARSQQQCRDLFHPRQDQAVSQKILRLPGRL